MDNLFRIRLHETNILHPFPPTLISLARRGSVLVQGMVGSVTCVTAHPDLPRLVILCDSGDVHLWDYNLKARNKMKGLATT